MQSGVVPPLSQNPIRNAGEAFLRATSFGWTSRDLATWLVCHYAPCLAIDAAIHAAREDREDIDGPRLDTASIREVIYEARQHALRLIGDLGSPILRAELGGEAARAGSIIDLGGRGHTWAPVGRSRMRLVVRVGSLFIADALNYPADYRGVVHCVGCGGVGFDTPISHQRWCRRADRSVA